MHHHTENEERAVNLSILAVSGTGEFFCVESNESCWLHSWRSPAKRNLYMLQTARSVVSSRTRLVHAMLEQNRPVNTCRLLCPCDCLDLLPLSHDRLGHALGKVKHEDPVLTLLNRLDSVCTPSMYKPGSPCHRPRSIRATLPGTGGSTSARRPMDTLLLHMFPCTSVGSVLMAAPPPPLSSKSKMVCSSTPLSKFGDISCAPSLEHGHVAGLAVRCRLQGAVGTSTRADACAFSSEPQLPRARPTSQT